MNDNHNGNEYRQITRRRFLKGTAAVVGGSALAQTLPAAAAPTLRPVARQGAAINVMDAAFGARGDGSTNDRAAFQAAIDAAIAARAPLLIPRTDQFYRIALDAEHKNLRVNGDLTIVGDGRDATLLRFTVQNAGTGPFAAFYIPGGVNFQLTGLRLEEDLHQPVEQFEFIGLFFESGGVDHACLVESVDIDGFTHCLYTPASSVDGGMGELFLTVRDCDIHPWWQYCIAFWAVPDGHKRLHIYDSNLHDNQHSHLVYCHPHNSVHIENTRFDGSNGWAFHFQGTSVSGDPEYQRFIGCWFGPRNSRALITQDREAVTIRVEVRNCIFEAALGIQVRSDIIVDGCYFTTVKESTVESSFIAAYSNAPWQATIRNCIFAPKGNALPQVDFRLENIEVEIENCQFYNQGLGMMLCLGGGPTNRYLVRDCLFYNRPDNAAYSVSVEVNNGQATIERCRFIGRATVDRGVILCRSVDGGPSAESFVQIDQCTFQSISGGTLFYFIQPTGAGWSNKLAGANNQIVDLQIDKPIFLAESPTPVIGRLIPVNNKAPSAIPAGQTMIVSSNYDTYDVSGPADVANIHWWTADGLSNALFTGAITLIATSPFSLLAGGNIQLAGGAARRDIPASGSVRLSYDPAQGFWSEG